MKKTKKLLALALALALMLSLSYMAMPTMAMENGSARIRTFCSKCDQYQEFGCLPTSGVLHELRTVGGCSVTNKTHTHEVHYQTCIRVCSGCDVQVMKHEHIDHQVCKFKG